jgi:two-component system response regulator FlrC
LGDGDTLLIENIDECSPAALLRVRKAMDRFPMNRVRWIVTSRGDAASWMDSSSVARELAYRLCVVNLRMPRLQDRREDIADLARLFLRVCCLVNGLPEKTLSTGAIEALIQYPWVGHVAELNNVIEKAALTSEQSQIEAGDLFFLSETQDKAEQIQQLVQGGMSLFEMERKLIFQTLELTRQNKTRAAQILGISIRTLRNKLNTYREGGLNVGAL